MRGKLKATWFDGGRWPQSPPNPAYPEGIDFPASSPTLPHCRISLPYPAKRIGHYVVDCATCGMTILVTTAGRPDDPRSVAVNCKVLQ